MPGPSHTAAASPKCQRKPRNLPQPSHNISCHRPPNCNSIALNYSKRLRTSGLSWLLTVADVFSPNSVSALRDSRAIFCWAALLGCAGFRKSSLVRCSCTLRQRRRAQSAWTNLVSFEALLLLWSRANSENEVLAGLGLVEVRFICIEINPLRTLLNRSFADFGRSLSLWHGAKC